MSNYMNVLRNDIICTAILDVLIGFVMSHGPNKIYIAAIPLARGCFLHTWAQNYNASLKLRTT